MILTLHDIVTLDDHFFKRFIITGHCFGNRLLAQSSIIVESWRIVSETLKGLQRTISGFFIKSIKKNSINANEQLNNFTITITYVDIFEVVRDIVLGYLNCDLMEDRNLLGMF